MSSVSSLELAREYINKTVTVFVDRRIGSRHPKHGFVYHVNYGYIDGIVAPDGEYLDAYILGVDMPLEKFRGICIGVIHRENDDDDKLIVVPDGASFTDEEILSAVDFQEQWFKSSVVRV